MDKEFRTRRVFSKYLEILFTKFLIAFKQIREYPSNSFSILFVDVLVGIIYFIFFSIYFEVLDNFLGWNSFDFIMYYLFGLLGWKFLWLFSLANFRTFLLKGELNVVLCKPINSIFYFSIRNSNGATIFTLIILLILLSTLLFIGDFSNYMLAIFLGLFGAFLFSLYFSFFESFSFFMKRTDYLVETAHKVDNTGKRFTPAVFDNLRYNFFMVMPSVIGSFYVVSVLNGNLKVFYDHFIYMLMVLFILVSGILLLWHFGLRRYEGYG